MFSEMRVESRIFGTVFGRIGSVNGKRAVDESCLIALVWDIGVLQLHITGPDSPSEDIVLETVPQLVVVPCH